MKNTLKNNYNYISIYIPLILYENKFSFDECIH